MLMHLQLAIAPKRFSAQKRLYRIQLLAVFIEQKVRLDTIKSLTTARKDRPLEEEENDLFFLHHLTTAFLFRYNF
jgi:hypothetical protein